MLCVLFIVLGVTYVMCSFCFVECDDMLFGLFIVLNVTECYVYSSLCCFLLYFSAVSEVVLPVDFVSLL